jgi:hypothetical protein
MRSATDISSKSAHVRLGLGQSKIRLKNLQTMNKLRATLAMLAVLAALQLPAQKTTVFTEAQLAYKRALR